MDRAFQEIPKGTLAEADKQSFLVNLGWSDASTWENLLQSKRILLISEAGSGKTYECRKQAKRLWDDGKPAFFIELATLASSPGLQSLFDFEEEERFDTWLSSQSGIATFFLDSYDELKLTRGSFEQALKRLKKAIRNQLHRVRIVITTRPIPFDERLVRSALPVPSSVSNKSKEETFADIAMNKRQQKLSWAEFGVEKEEIRDWRVVALMPLSDQQIVEFADTQGVNEPKKLLEDLQKRNAQEFARRPQDLIELCLDWREHKRIRMHKDQVASNIRIKLQSREDRPEPAELSVDKAIDGASRLALAMLVMRRLTIRHNAASDDTDQEAALNPSLILSDWRPDELKALLERPLFGFASYGRVRFHHRSVLEYLAAERLQNILGQKGMAFSALKRLIFADTRGKIIVRPTMRPVAGWLAVTQNKIFEILRDNEPAVLLNEGDPEALTQTQRSQALCAYVKRHRSGGWRGLSVPHIQAHRFAFPELAHEINQLWGSGIENPEVRRILLSLIEAGRITECTDIAYGVAVDIEASHSERLDAIDALVACTDSRLSHIASELSSGSDLWQGTVARGAIVRLFPSSISIEQLCRVLSWLEEEKNSVTGFSWQLSHFIARAEFDKASLEELRDGLVDLISDGLRRDKEWKPLTCDRPHLSGVLIAVCGHGLALEKNSQWLYASLFALHIQEREHNSDKAPKILREQLKNLPADANECLFWLEDSLLQKFHPITTPWQRSNKILGKGIVKLNVDRDFSWIKSYLGDSARDLSDRAFMLENALRLLREQDILSVEASKIKKLVNDQPNLIAEINDWLKPRKLADWEKKQAKRNKQQERKEAENKSAWIQFWREIEKHPERVFASENSQNTVYDLWRVMKNGEEDHKASGWNRRFIEEQFGEQLADNLRLRFMDIWRKEIPTLPSERPENERNTYLVRWSMGLAAIYAEAEDPEWATKLSEEEARLAAQYAAIESGKLPLWLEQLVIAHPDAVDMTLGEELSWELEHYSKTHGHSMLLQEVSNSSERVIKLFIPRLRSWLDQNLTGNGLSSYSTTNQLQRVIDTLLKDNDENVRSYILTTACQCLNNNPSDELTAIWLPTIIKLSPYSGVEKLENQFKNVKPSKNSEAVQLLSLFFNHHHQQVAITHFPPELLIRLLRLAYTHVRREDDIQHEGTFTPPGVRDDAQDARNYILEVLLNSKGKAAWQAKQELAEDPLFSHMKDRIFAIAEENWAQEIDSETFDDVQAIALDRSGEAPAATNSAMFSILQDRLSDLDDLLLSDTSPREAWTTINSEKAMRRVIAHELKHASNAIYTVDQEAVTADEKETDIRLRSTVSSHEAIIELKLADNRSARDLRDTIYNQLVKKYMTPETSRSGCLLITLAKERQWEHPDNGQRIGLPELKGLLVEEAKRVEEKVGNSVFLTIHILDLRPRLPKEK